MVEFFFHFPWCDVGFVDFFRGWGEREREGREGFYCNNTHVTARSQKLSQIVMKIYMEVDTFGVVCCGSVFQKKIFMV